MKKIALILVIIAAALYSCVAGQPYATVMVSFAPPDNAELTVRDIRVRGFTLDWTAPPDNAYAYEFAVAVSHDGNIENYETAREHGHIVLGFTPEHMLNGTHRVTGLLPGREYQIRLFVRSRNMESAEYLRGSAALPFVDEAQMLNAWINGEQAIFDRADDSFSVFYLPGMAVPDEFVFTYQLARGCVLYIGGARTYAEEIALESGVPLEVTVYHERTGAARDYIIYVGARNNGLPIVILDTGGRAIESRSRTIPARLRIIDSEHNPLGIGLYDGPIEIRGRGNSSWGMPKQGWSFRIPERRQLLDMPPSRTWLLIANFADKSLMRNFQVYEFARDIGMSYAPRMRFVDLILNGVYMGTYNLGERVRVGEGRIDLPRIRYYTTCEYELTGTYLLEITERGRLRRYPAWFTTPHIDFGNFTVFGQSEGNTVVIRQPSGEHLSEEAFNYIRDYFRAADSALFGDNFTCPERGYRAYIDVASWIDWYLINEWVKNVDGDFRLSTYLYKPRGGKLHMGPVWDFDLAAGNANYRTGYDPEGWYIRTSVWHSRLFQDPWFEQQFNNRWNYLRANGYFERVMQRIDETADKIRASAEMNFRRWPILGRWVWPNANAYWERVTFQCEIDYLKEWLTERMEWIDRQVNGGAYG